MSSNRWKEYKFEELTINHNNKRIPLSSKQRAEKQGEFNYYGAQGVIDHIDEYIFEGEYLLIAEDGANLETRNEDIARLTKKNEKFWVNNHAHIIRANEKADIRYLMYFLNSSDISGYVTGSAQPKLNKANLNSIKINLPEKKEQESIADILFSLDKKIETNNQINKKLEEMAQAIFKQWFVDFEFPNEDGEPYKSSGGEMVESELGMIPKGWEVGTLGDIIKISSGKRPKKKSKEINQEFKIPLIGASSVMGYVKEYNYYEPIIVIGRVGTHGVIQRFNSKVWASDNTLVIKSRYYEYVHQLLGLIEYSSLNRGSTQPLITQTDIKNVKTIIPRENVLNQYELKSGSLYKLIDNGIDENVSLVNLRDTLLSKLMSGEIRVPLK